MTIVSNDPSWWPTISWNVSVSYWIVAAGAVVVYDWVLTLGQEIELIWRQRWSLITVLYLVIRYIGIPYSVVDVLSSMPLISLTDSGCNIVYRVQNGTMAIPTMLGIIMIARLHAMYQGSRMMLVFLVIVFLAINIACGVIGAIVLQATAAEWILSGTYMCTPEYGENAQLLFSMVWTLCTIWEVLVLCLSVLAAMKHFRRLGPSTGSTIRDCFRVLIKSHVLYFASFVCVSFLELASFSPKFQDSSSIGIQTLGGALQVLSAVRMFVLGPRLILSVREYHAKVVANSDTETSMNSIVFQEHIHVSTSSTV